jgi:hypothetical protein
VTEEFSSIAARLAAIEGHGALGRLVLPYPLEGLPDEEVHAIAVDAYPRLVELLGVVA